MALSSKDYSGAGILIVDTNSLSVVLVNDYTKNYNCCVGQMIDEVNDPERIEKTTSDELYEETCNILSCTPNNWRHFLL